MYCWFLETGYLAIGHDVQTLNEISGVWWPGLAVIARSKQMSGKSRRLYNPAPNAMVIALGRSIHVVYFSLRFNYLFSQ